MAGISIVHQEIPVCDDLTAAENIFLGQSLPRRGGLVEWGEVNRRAAEIFSRLRVDIEPTAVVRTLSIAHKQIVVIAQALSTDARLVILDEPTSALSKQEVENLFEIIAQLKAQGITVVYVSHRLDEVFSVADRITALRDGRYVGTIERSAATADRIVQMMVGREITNLFPKVFHQPAEHPLLTVSSLTVPGVFEDVSFEVRGGEVLGLVGLQGSGTSDVMRALFGRYKQMTGEVRLRGKPIELRSSLDAIGKGIAYVPADRQAEGLFPGMSVVDNASMLALPRLSKSLGWIADSDLARLVGAAIRRFHVRTASISAPVLSLSGGNQQKVVIARSLSLDPLLILLDDPTRGIDVGAKAEVHQILNELTAQGCGVILVSSELPEVLAMSDRIVIMYKGRTRACLDPRMVGHEQVMAHRDRRRHSRRLGKGRELIALIHSNTGGILIHSAV